MKFYYTNVLLKTDITYHKIDLKSSQKNTFCQKKIKKSETHRVPLFLIKGNIKQIQKLVSHLQHE